MRKRVGCLCLFLSLGLCAVRADDRPAIPPNVKYTFIDEQADAACRATLAAQFAQGEAGVVDLFHSPCICAPGYWQGLSAADGKSFKAPLPTSFSVQNRKTGVKDKMAGATLKNPEDLADLARRFSRDIGPKPVIRRLTTDEIALFWTIYPFDIEEPVYAIVNGNRCFVLCLMKNEKLSQYEVSWLDELTAYN